jgi:hypothetical protein
MDIVGIPILGFMDRVVDDGGRTPIMLSSYIHRRGGGGDGADHHRGS